MNAAHFEYVQRLGDNALILGQRLSEWCGHSPFLEEDIAMANTALDLIGQARAMLTRAGELEGLEHDEDHLAFLRDERDYLNLTMVELPRGDFAFTVLRNAMVATLLQAAALAESEGTSCEVVDVRSLSPIDYAPILDSVRRTGRMVYAQEAPGNVSVGSEVAATVMERAFFALESPVIRVSGFDVPFPPAKLEGTYLPDADRILEAVDRALAY